MVWILSINVYNRKGCTLYSDLRCYITLTQLTRIYWKWSQSKYCSNLEIIIVHYNKDFENFFISIGPFFTGPFDFLNPRAINPAQKSIGTPKFYRVEVCTDLLKLYFDKILFQIDSNLKSPPESGLSPPESGLDLYQVLIQNNL